MEDEITIIYSIMLKENIINASCEKKDNFYVVDIIYKDEYSKKQYVIVSLSSEKDLKNISIGV
jgi:hypothetical protein